MRKDKVWVVASSMQQVQKHLQKIIAKHPRVKHDITVKRRGNDQIDSVETEFKIYYAKPITGGSKNFAGTNVNSILVDTETKELIDVTRNLYASLVANNGYIEEIKE